MTFRTWTDYAPKNAPGSKEPLPNGYQWINGLWYDGNDYTSYQCEACGYTIRVLCLSGEKPECCNKCGAK